MRHVSQVFGEVSREKVSLVEDVPNSFKRKADDVAQTAAERFDEQASS